MIFRLSSDKNSADIHLNRTTVNRAVSKNELPLIIVLPVLLTN